MYANYFMNYTWQEFDKDVKKLADKITEDHNFIFNSIYGIPRGGLILAVKLSHIFETKMIFNVNEITKKTLVVDEIIETGKTISKLLEKLKNIKPKVICLHYHLKSTFIPYIYLRKVPNNDFIIYPWEV